MANLEPMPISSLPEGDIQDGDKMVIYRETTGKAYQTDAGIIEELSADLTDLGGRLITMTMTNNTTYRILFGSGNITNNSTVCIIFARGQQGTQHLSLFFNGYGYGSGRMVVFELTKGNAMSYEFEEDNMAIQITNSATNTAGTSAVIGVFMLCGALPTIETV